MVPNRLRRTRSVLRRALLTGRTGLAGLALVASSTACSFDSGPPSEAAPSATGPAPSATGPATPAPPMNPGSTPTLDPRPVRLKVDVVRVVGGEKRRKQVRVVERQVGRAVGAYFDGAFLGGPYPRARFPRAFDAFSRGAAAEARRDRPLLTNVGTAPRTVAVVPRKKKVLLDVLVPNRIAVAATARVRLVFVQQRERGADRRVTVTGRLLLDRAPRGGWQIFGYDLSRSAVPTGKGNRR